VTERAKALVVGSFNQAKAAEMAELLRGLEFPIRSLKDFPAVRPVPETGETFAENAREKALGLVRQIGEAEILGVVADDSGLEVDALGGRPGVRSARYVSESATDPERVQRILQELGDLPAERRTARFRCHVALANAERVLIETEGAVEGRIAFAPAGEFGFGYDPIFIPHGYDLTFGEIGADLKPRISHRAVALRHFRDQLLALLKGPSEYL
jgi:XTP/dITP diphosphohydrolase